MLFSAPIWISLSKWPMLQTIAMFFIARMWSTVMMSMLPVAVTKMSARGAGFFHRHDFIAFHRGLERADRIDFGHQHARGRRCGARPPSPCRHRRSRQNPATLPASMTSVRDGWRRPAIPLQP